MAGYRCPACDAALAIDDFQALKLHCPSCGIAYLRIGGRLVTRAKDEGPPPEAPGYRCPACDAALAIDDAQALKLHCPSCGIEYLRIGGSLVTRTKDKGPQPEAPGYRCADCSSALEIEDLQAFKLRCPSCQTEYRRVGGTLMTRAEYERHDPDRIPRARAKVKE